MKPLEAAEEAYKKSKPGPEIFKLKKELEKARTEAAACAKEFDPKEVLKKALEGCKKEAEACFDKEDKCCNKAAEDIAKKAGADLKYSGGCYGKSPNVNAAITQDIWGGWDKCRADTKCAAQVDACSDAAAKELSK